METHSSILAGRTPWTEEPCRTQSVESDVTERLNNDVHGKRVLKKWIYVYG